MWLVTFVKRSSDAQMGCDHRWRTTVPGVINGDHVWGYRTLIHSILSERDPYAEALLLSEFSYSRQWFGDSADFLISHHLLFFHLSRNSFHGPVDHSMSNGLVAKPAGQSSIHRTNNGRRTMIPRSSLTSLHTQKHLKNHFVFIIQLSN